MTVQCVNYQEIKERVRMEDVLSRYGLLGHLRKEGRSLTGCCPIHNGSNENQFLVDTEKNNFTCFHDHWREGNVIDFVMKMERVSLQDAALLLNEWFPGSSPAAPVYSNIQVSTEQKGEI